jgi:hypothetical protein
VTKQPLAASRSRITHHVSVSAFARRGPRGAPRAWPPIAAFALAFALVLAHAAHRWPLAFGALMKPETDALARGSHPLELLGVALDARGIARIEARLDDAHPTELVLAPGVSTARAFPIAGGEAARDFSGRIEDAGEARVLSIVVVNDDGVETGVDRRFLR